MRLSIRLLLCVIAGTAAAGAFAAPVTYNVDPEHTHPSFEVDHFGGMSVWRGKFNENKGTIVLDREAQAGTVDITIDMDSVDLGLEKLHTHLKGTDPGMFDVAKYPTATYKGKVSKWNGSAPAEIDGQLTIKGVTKPLKLTVNRFLCKPHPMQRREVCGADASGTFMRDDFGVDYGKSMGFKMDTKLLISIEAIKAE